MATTLKGQKGFLDINNNTLAKEQLSTIYKEAYMSNLGLDQLFAFRDATKFGLFFKKKKPIKYKTGDGSIFNTDIMENPEGENKLFKYTKAEMQEFSVELSTVIQFARRLDPIEESFLEESIVSAEIADLVDIEIMNKRKLIMSKIQKTDGDGATPIYVDSDPKLKPFDFHDKMVDYCDEFGLNKNRLVVLASMDIIRAIRDKLQLEIGASPEVQNVLGVEQPLAGAMKSLEGITYLGVPNLTTFVNENGERESVSLLNKDVQLIAFEANDKYSPFIARKKEHTPLRVGPAAIGSGQGATIIIEKQTVYGFDIIEPMRILQVIKGKKPTTPPEGEDDGKEKNKTTKNNDQQAKETELKEKEKELNKKIKELEAKEKEIHTKETELEAKEKELHELEETSLSDNGENVESEEGDNG